MVYRRGRELEENEEQGKNKKMKSIVVEEQEQEQEQEQEEGSETGFVDLDEDTLLNVLKRVDPLTLGRVAGVNKLWLHVARDKQLWEPIHIRYLARRGMLRYIDRYRNMYGWPMFGGYACRRLISDIVKPPPAFYSIDFSKKITPWV